MNKPRADYAHETLYITDLVRNSSPFLDGLTFTKCILRGPAFLRAHSHCTLAYIATPYPPAHVVTAVKEGTSAVGIIMLTNCTFRDCYFETISMLGTEKDCKQLVQAFHTEALDQWKERIGFNPTIN